MSPVIDQPNVLGKHPVEEIAPQGLSMTHEWRMVRRKVKSKVIPTQASASSAKSSGIQSHPNPSSAILVGSLEQREKSLMGTRDGIQG